MFALFGGHRLWHGYAPLNSQDNNWDELDKFQRGGYMDDLWLYTKWLDSTTRDGETFKSNDGALKFLQN